MNRYFEKSLLENINRNNKCLHGDGILFLSNNKQTLPLYEWLSHTENVYLLSDCLQLKQVVELQPALIVSYNYMHIITDDIIEYMNGKIINLHISYLPWNRGASPNVWSFIDDTPKGVTIHQVSSGLDKGLILFQRECFFEEEHETFASTYKKLNDEIIRLFQEHWHDIKNNNYILTEQIGKGSYHNSKQLEELQRKIPFEWDDNIGDFLRRYRSLEKY